ncbi:acyltransferase [Roseomonas sp. CAU 1739]|uniref:acyltransferase family protein n=1 Tax=Roseomonas sp. CAU 1739 TaxID=3140364 RepID=UPI00325B7260
MNDPMAVDRPNDSAPPTGETFAYIDAVRGWAIILVMTTHVGGSFPELYWPLKKLTNFGWHGVQLFFIASAVTLCYSWNRSIEPYGRRALNFFIRRFLRIAPLYYFGVVFYMVVQPPGSGFSVAQLLRSVFFINAWHPDWIPTTPGWMVVPGGWSIGVEFTFYALFPLLIVFLSSTGRAVAMLILAIVVAIMANTFGLSFFQEYSGVYLNNFLYFWFFNQMPVFMIGFVVFCILRSMRNFRLSRRNSWVLLGLTVLLLVIAALNPAASDRFVPDTIPQIFIASSLLGVFVLLMAISTPTLFSHPIIQRIGVLSFSCYVMHFVFVHTVPAWSGGWIDTTVSGPRAVITAAVLWVLVVAMTVATSTATNRWIEQPGMRLARHLTRRRGAVVADPASGITQSGPPRSHELLAKASKAPE